MAIRGTAQQASDKWKNRLSGAGAEVAAGVARVTVAPGQLAAAKRQKWLMGIQNAADKWQRNVAAVPLETWKRYMTEVGVPRIAQGAQAKQAKFTDFMNEFLPHLEQGVNKLANMPDVTFEDRIAKSVAMMRHNHDFRRSGSRG